MNEDRRDACPTLRMDEGLRSELSRQGVFTTTLEELYNWGRKNSVWPLGLAWPAVPSR